MRRHFAILLAISLISIGLPIRAAGVQATWQELQTMIAGKKITLVLPDGAELRGNVLAVEPGQLVLDVTKTSDQQSHPKGRNAIPRASVTTLTMTRSHTRWKVLGTAIGLGIGLAIALPVNAYAHNEGDGAPAAVAAIIAVPAAAGFLIGRSADRKTVTITVRD